MTTVKITPNAVQLKELYLCGIRTGYPTPRQAKAASESWDNHAVYDCEYCPGVHHVKADALVSEENLLNYASEHWDRIVAQATAS